MSGVRHRSPELLTWLVGTVSVAATTLMLHHRWNSAGLRAGVAWPAELSLGLETAGASLVAGFAVLLLHRLGHRTLALTTAAAWTLAQGLTAATGLNPWVAFVSPFDEPDASPLASAVVTLAVAASSLLPVSVARALDRAAPRSPVAGARTAAALGAAVVLGTLAWAAANGDTTGMDDGRWLTLALAVTTSAALAGAWRAGRRPDGVTLTHLVLAVVAWRVLAVGLGHPEGLVSMTDDALWGTGAAAGAVLGFWGASVRRAWSRLSGRGPVMWGRRAGPATGGEGAPAPLLPAALSAPEPVPAPRPSARALAAAAAVTLAVTGVVAWQAHVRSPERTRETLAAARGDADGIDASSLGASWRRDVTGTACGDGLWTWCGTTPDEPRDAADVLRKEMAAQGWRFDDVTCGADDAHRAAPISIMPWIPVCTATARKGDATVAVVAADTLGAMFEDGTPGVRQRATSVMVGAWAAHDDPVGDAVRPEPVALDRAAVTPLAAAVAGDDWTADVSCATDHAQASGADQADVDCRTWQVSASPRSASGAADPRAALDVVRDRLLGAGFLVAQASCDPRDESRCRFVAQRWTLPDRRGGLLVIGRPQSPEDTALVTLTVGTLG